LAEANEDRERAGKIVSAAAMIDQRISELLRGRRSAIGRLTASRQGRAA
jgi:hypothetical protein